MAMNVSRYRSVLFRVLDRESSPDRGTGLFGDEHPSQLRVATMRNSEMSTADTTETVDYTSEQYEDDLRRWFAEIRRREALGWAAAEMLRREKMSERRITELTGVHRNTAHRRTRDAALVADALCEGMNAPRG